QLIRYPNLNQRLISKDLHALMCQLAGVRLSLGEYAQLLISLPHRVAWTLEGLRWHRDISQAQFARTPGIQAFILLDDLSEKGGATVALAGSHRLKRPDQAKQVLSTLGSGGARQRIIVDGIPLFFIEMEGRAGDVYLMDMRLLHTPSINA